MKYLLPHKFKKIGAITAPLGFAVWIAMQWGYVTKAIHFFFDGKAVSAGNAFYQNINTAVAIISFFSFLAGAYFLTFSKEKIEDEMVQRTRLDSFQFAALTQIIFIIVGFSTMLLYKDPTEGGLMLFLIAIILLFWLCFIGRFNYILHFKIERTNKA